MHYSADTKQRKKTFNMWNGNSLVRFQVSVYDAVVVKVLQSQDSLSKIHPSHVHRQRTNVLQEVGTIPTLEFKDSQKLCLDFLNVCDVFAFTVGGQDKKN